MNENLIRFSFEELGKHMLNRMLTDVAFLWIGLPIGVFAGGILYATLGVVGMATEARIAISVTLTLTYISILGVAEVRAAIRSQAPKKGEAPRHVVRQLEIERDHYAREFRTADRTVRRLTADNRAIAERVETLQHAVTEMLRREKIMEEYIKGHQTTSAPLGQTPLPEPNEELMMNLEDLKNQIERLRQESETYIGSLNKERDFVRKEETRRRQALTREQELRNADQQKRP